MYGALPAYRAMLDREGLAGPEELLVAGTEDEVRERLAEFAAAGTTDLRAAPLAKDRDEALRTRELLAALAREASG